MIRATRFSAYLAAEKLRELHSIDLGRETVRVWMTEAGRGMATVVWTACQTVAGWLGTGGGRPSDMPRDGMRQDKEA